MQVEDDVARSPSPSLGTPDPSLVPPFRTELGMLRAEVAVLRERVTAAERVLAEREQRIRDLRGSLWIVAAGRLADGEGSPPATSSGNGSKVRP
jgi:hypothetical protein